MAQLPIIRKIIDNLDRYELWKDLGKTIGVYDRQAGRFGDLVKGNYSVHLSEVSPSKLNSIFNRGLEPRIGSGGQPPLLFSWNTLNNAGLVPEKLAFRSGEYMLPPRMHNAPSNILAFLIKNNADTSFGRGGIPGSLTTRVAIPPEDLRIFIPESYEGRRIPKQLAAKIPSESLINIEDVVADSILNQLFAQELK